MGKLIDIEGIDGSGKATQAKLLADHLKADGRRVFSLAFPRYGEPVVEEIKKYLKENPTKDPYGASKLYARDRADAAPQIRAWLAEGDVVLDRFTDSNAAHQGGKIADSAERAKYVAWNFDYEYRELGIPKPDLVVFLHVPAAFSSRLIDERGRAKDGHEADPKHLAHAEESYLWVAQRYPEDHRIVECVENGRLLSREEIHEKVYEIVKSLL